MKVWCPRCREVTITDWDQLAPGEFEFECKKCKKKFRIEIQFFEEE